MQHLNTIEQAILNELRYLTEAQQSHLLGFIQSISPKQVSNSAHLVRFAGSIDPEDLNTMQEAIAGDCENIDLDEW